MHGLIAVQGRYVVELRGKAGAVGVPVVSPGKVLVLGENIEVGRLVVVG